MNAMNHYLAKIDPDTYGVDDLERDGTTVWNGVRNPQALQAIKAMRPNDRVFVYHSGAGAGVVGLMKVVSEPRPDTQIEKSWVVDVEFLLKYDEPVGLHQIKASHLFDDWSLVRQGRLSIMAAPEKFVKWMQEKGYRVV